ncbi:UNKNOWN [Stylonychia lemnae]|uniref:Uncharacterized protein n=1 Tax=Stylonychia lemnae TaxID=5949 RepID=A0A077ZZ33_STYLE|nr:UNKNOWN [Stylonychia lemnae]|eukprot:CDW74463.1 UNKNOWN [Stylonychia lemnae]
MNKDLSVVHMQNSNSNANNNYSHEQDMYMYDLKQILFEIRKSVNPQVFIFYKKLLSKWFRVHLHNFFVDAFIHNVSIQKYESAIEIEQDSTQKDSEEEVKEARLEDEIMIDSGDETRVIIPSSFAHQNIQGNQSIKGTKTPPRLPPPTQRLIIHPSITTQQIENAIPNQNNPTVIRLTPSPNPSNTQRKLEEAIPNTQLVHDQASIIQDNSKNTQNISSLGPTSWNEPNNLSQNQQLPLLRGINQGIEGQVGYKILKPLNSGDNDVNQNNKKDIPDENSLENDSKSSKVQISEGGSIINSKKQKNINDNKCKLIFEVQVDRQQKSKAPATLSYQESPQQQIEVQNYSQPQSLLMEQQSESQKICINSTSFSISQSALKQDQEQSLSQPITIKQNQPIQILLDPNQLSQSNQKGLKGEKSNPTSKRKRNNTDKAQPNGQIKQNNEIQQQLELQQVQSQQYPPQPQEIQQQSSSKSNNSIQIQNTQINNQFQQQPQAYYQIPQNENHPLENQLDEDYNRSLNQSQTFEALGEAKKYELKFKEILKQYLKMKFSLRKAQQLQQSQQPQFEIQQQQQREATHKAAYQNNMVSIQHIFTETAAQNGLTIKDQDAVSKFMNDELSEFIHKILLSLKSYFENEIKIQWEQFQTHPLEFTEEQNEQLDWETFVMTIKEQSIRFFFIDNQDFLGSKKITQYYKEKLF